MIFGIGTDIVALARIEALHQRYGTRFAQRILSKAEMEELQSDNYPARMLMKRFAAKEALSKAAGTGLRHPLSMQNISVVHDDQGKPMFEFATDLASHLTGLRITRHHLSISDERDVAVAFVILEGEL
jgi:holo-[acyl-carrier protein] synthase